MERGGCVYIITNKNNTTLYTGVSSNLQARIWDHLNKVDTNSFSAKYNLNKLVYYAFYPTIEEAIIEEKRIKAGSRKKKEELIDANNPEWLDLYPDLLIN